MMSVLFERQKSVFWLCVVYMLWFNHSITYYYYYYLYIYNRYYIHVYKLYTLYVLGDESERRNPARPVLIDGPRLAQFSQKTLAANIVIDAGACKGCGRRWCDNGGGGVMIITHRDKIYNAGRRSGMIRRRCIYATACRLSNPFSGGGDIGGSGEGHTGNENRPARTHGIW